MAKHGQRPVDILDASIELFAERGFAKVKVDDIGKLAGVSGPAVYRHFGGKDEILVTLFDEALDRLIEATAGKSDDPFDELARLVRGHTEFLLAERRLAGVKIREDRALAEPYRQRLQRRELRYLQRWSDCLQRCYPQASEERVVAARNGAVGAINSIVSWPPSVVAVDGVADLLAEVVLGMLAALRDD